MNGDWFAAARRGDTRTLARWIERGIEVDTPGDFGRTALMIAVWGRHLETARWPLK